MAWQGTLKTALARDKTPARGAGPQVARAVRRGILPFWVKLPYTIFVGIALVVYGTHGRPGHLLWFLDVALVGTLIALWFERRLLAGMMALAVLAPATAWNVSFLGRVFGGFDPFGLAGYAFDPSVPVAVRGLSLFHVLLPPLLLWMVHRLSYDPRALAAQTLLAWAALVSTQALAAPMIDIPWTLGISAGLPQAAVLSALWLLTLMLFYPLVVYLPTHLVLRALFRNRRLRTGA